MSTITAINLKPQQAQALACLSSATGLKLLTGVAGSGKTTIVENLTRRQPYKLLAMTDQAAINLESLTGHAAQTFHSYFGIYPNIDEETGKQFFTPGNEPALLEEDTNLVIDEVSMLPDWLYKAVFNPVLLDKLAATDGSIVLVGDQAQLPPVDSTCSLPWDLKDKAASAHLSEAVRYTGKTLEIANKVRECRKPHHAPMLLDGFDTIARAEVRDRLQDKDYYYLSWTNKACSLVADWIEESTYRPLNPFRAWEGDLLGTVNSKGLAKLNYPVIEPCPYDHVTLESQYPALEGIKLVLSYCHLNSLDLATFATAEDASMWAIISDNVRKGIMTDWKGTILAAYGLVVYSKKQAWDAWHRVNSSVAVLRKHRSMTVHKSQGSTLTKVILDSQDIARCRDAKLVQSLLYTALTRARQEVLIVD